METVEEHPHAFEDADWPFAHPVNVAVITTRHVLEGTRPILLVSHDADDEGWQVLCGTTTHKEDLAIACLGCMYALDPTIGALADLPLGWVAWRDTPRSHWQRERDS